MSRGSVAVSTQDAEVGLQRVVTLRVFNRHVHRLALLALVEAAIVVLAVHAAIFVRFAGFSSTLIAFQHTVGPIAPRALLIAVVFLVSLASLGLYRLQQRAGFTGVLVRLFMALVLAQATLALIFYAVPSIAVGRGVYLLVGGFAFVGLGLWRYIYGRLVDEEIFKRRVLVWGGGRRAACILRRLRRRTDQRGFKLIGYVRVSGDGPGIPDEKLLRFDGDLLRLALREKVEEIVVAMDDRRSGFPTDALLECRLRGIQVTDVATFVERESGRMSIELMSPSWLIFSNGFRCDLFRLVSKRLFDIVASLAILIAAAPLALLAAIAIWLEDRGPILYRQVRAGLNGAPFTIFKFRSMRVGAERPGEAVWAKANDNRVTRVGAVIRKLRIDEIPQLINVLLGHMSFVGPRPERPTFVERLSGTIPYYRERHSVKPGITGWAQVRYSYGASQEDAKAKLEYDLYYVKHHSLAFDLMVLLQTVEIVLFRIGAR